MSLLGWFGLRILWPIRMAEIVAPAFDLHSEMLFAAVPIDLMSEVELVLVLGHLG